MKHTGQMLAFSQVMAFLWWLSALYLRTLNILPVWYDQQTHLSNVASQFLAPYALPGYVYPPWAAVLLLPFGGLPLPLSALIQAMLLFGLLALVLCKYDGGWHALILTLCSFVAFDAVLELNIDWIVLIGLLVPPAWSGPFLLVKPQDALGVLATFDRKTLQRTALITAGLVIVSLAIWGLWPIAMWDAIRTYTLGRSFNLAPLTLLPWPVSVAIGCVLGERAIRCHDRALSILAWLFFVPYITLYSLLLPFAMLALKSVRLALIIAIVTWGVYGAVLLIGLFRR